MKILSTQLYPYEFDNQLIQKFDEGRWYHLDRVFIFKTVENVNGITDLVEDHSLTLYQAFSLNLAERIVAFVAQLFNPNYFSSKLKVLKATVLNSKDLHSEMEAQKQEKIEMDAFVAKELEAMKKGGLLWASFIKKD